MQGMLEALFLAACCALAAASEPAVVHDGSTLLRDPEHGLEFELPGQWNGGSNENEYFHSNWRFGAERGPSKLGIHSVELARRFNVKSQLERSRSGITSGMTSVDGPIIEALDASHQLGYFRGIKDGRPIAIGYFTLGRLAFDFQGDSLTDEDLARIVASLRTSAPGAWRKQARTPLLVTVLFVAAALFCFIVALNRVHSAVAKEDDDLEVPIETPVAFIDMDIPLPYPLSEVSLPVKALMYIVLGCLFLLGIAVFWLEQ
jgi:hypothetical protein